VMEVIGVLELALFLLIHIQLAKFKPVWFQMFILHIS
jgi:hypothetical protein